MSAKTEAELHYDEAIRLQGLQLWHQASDAFDAATAAAERVVPPQIAVLVRSLNSLSLLRLRQSRLKDAEPLLARAMAAIDAHQWQGSLLHAQTMNNLATLRWYEGNRAAASAMLRHSHAMLQKIPGNAHRFAAMAVSLNLGEHAIAENRPAEAEPWLRDVIRTSEAHADCLTKDWLSAVTLLAHVLERLNRADDAATVLTEAIEQSRKSRSAASPHVIKLFWTLAQLRFSRGNLAEAERIIHESMAAQGFAIRGDGQGMPPDWVSLLGLCHLRQNRLAEAEACFRNVLNSYGDTKPADSLGWVIDLNNLGVALRDRGAFEEASTYLAQAVETAERLAAAPNARPAHHQHLANVLKNVALLQQRQGDDLAAGASFQQAVAVAEARLGPSHPKTIEIKLLLRELRAPHL